MDTLINVTVNGRDESVPDGTTVGAVVRRLAGRRAGIAVALNEDVLPRGAWDDTRLRARDRVEVLTAVQGG
jgi:sulfur carrier protein